MALAAVLASCGSDSDSNDEPPSAADTPPRIWSGQYVIEHPQVRLVRSLEIRPNGRYRAEIFQGFMAVDGCGGPFVGDGYSSGLWLQDGDTLSFAPEEDPGRLVIPFHRATITATDSGLVLDVAGEDGGQFPLIRMDGSR